MEPTTTEEVLMSREELSGRARRPTPLDPYPEPRLSEKGGDEKAYPPELGTDAIAVLEGRTFLLSDALGDVPGGSVGGLVHDDTRFLNRWEMRLEGRPLSLLKSRAVDYYSAAFYLTNPGSEGLLPNTIAVRRFRFVGNGLLEQLAAVNAGLEAARFELRLACGTDFADLFEMKSVVRDRSAWISAEHGSEGRSLRFSYEVPGFRAACTVRVVRSGIFDAASLEELADAPVRVEGDSFVWELEVAPRQLFGAVVRVELELNDALLEPMHEDFGEQQEASEGALTRWLEAAPEFESDSAALKAVYDKSIVDLAALRIEGTLADEPYVLPAAGLPWFMTLFGRDTLITSLQTLWVGPDLARGALHLLGELQGNKIDEFRDEEPGKILHEIRQGELTVLGEKPHSPYYGTADATPLWLILLSDYWRLSDDDGFVRDRWQRVLAALEWIDRFGDRDEDGYVEYGTRSSEGLGNQCWKDSWDGIQFEDGRIPFLPIATAEIQGYVYDAKLRVAELARRSMGDTRLPTGSSARPESSSPGSTATSGRTSAVATTSSVSTGTSRASTRSHRTWATYCGRGSCPRSGRAPLQATSSPRICSAAGACARSRDKISATTRSATTPGRSGRTTTRSSPSDWRVTDSATRPTGSPSPKSKPRRTRASVSPRRSQASTG